MNSSSEENKEEILIPKTNPTPDRPRMGQSNHEVSLLLRLPAELRNQIYEYVFGGLVICALAEPTAKRRYKVCYKDKRAGPPFEWFHITHITSHLLVCRQFYNETVAYIFQANDFKISDFDSSNLFIESLAAEKRNVIRRLIISNFQLRIFARDALENHRTGQPPGSKWITRLEGLETMTIKVLGWEIQGEKKEQLLKQVEKDAFLICGRRVNVIVKELWSHLDEF